MNDSKEVRAKYSVAAILVGITLLIFVFISNNLNFILSNIFLVPNLHYLNEVKSFRTNATYYILSLIVFGGLSAFFYNLSKSSKKFKLLCKFLVILLLSLMYISFFIVQFNTAFVCSCWTDSCKNIDDVNYYNSLYNVLATTPIAIIYLMLIIYGYITKIKEFAIYNLLLLPASYLSFLYAIPVSLLYMIILVIKFIVNKRERDNKLG